jgi:hypothetical protein
MAHTIEDHMSTIGQRHARACGRKLVVLDALKQSLLHQPFTGEL